LTIHFSCPTTEHEVVFQAFLLHSIVSRMHPLSSAAYQASMGYSGMDAGVQQQSPPEVEAAAHHDPTNGGDQVSLNEIL
jgi:hypothetical protein